MRTRDSIAYHSFFIPTQDECKGNEIKMKRFLDYASEGSKRAHFEHTGLSLLDLPDNILEQIWGLVSTSDIKNLLLVNHDHREALTPFLFTKVGVTWHQLLLDSSDCVLSKYSHTIRSINVILPDSQKEYKENTFGELLSTKRFPNLTRVAVNSTNSSYWLRYNKCDQIKDLVLYTDAPLKNRKIFDLAHVQHFTSLRLLTLDEYHFVVCEDEIVVPKLYRLNLHNCTWKWPFTLTNFNAHDTLTELSVSFSDDNVFVFSERFRDFLQTPLTGHSSSLRSLNIAFSNSSDNPRILLLNVLQSLLDAFYELETLSLTGWSANLFHIKHLLVTRRFHKPLRFYFEATILDPENTISEQVSRIQQVENLTFKLVHDNLDRK